ncbi:B12D [Micractinium conductrix]|uniref:B12D n=1 Tax=Micractinium conductrix TaxID=554055 RepID=A0A2P6V237_9CHLO|nr:B12D [Micractinium conductrix]|eukprot:PSC68150.1 B12D [Micractinium conductrix]
MSPAKAAFSWVPKVDLYPLFATCGLAVGFCAYSSFRHFWTNPDVHLVKGHRMDGCGEHPAAASRAEGWQTSVFRSWASLRKPDFAAGEDRPDTRIFRMF